MLSLGRVVVLHSMANDVDGPPEREVKVMSYIAFRAQLKSLYFAIFVIRFFLVFILAPFA